MEIVLKYRGREVTLADVADIRQLITENPRSSRRALSGLLCLKWGWVQENGALRDLVCRGLMLALHRSGQIQLPPPRQLNPNPLARRSRPRPVDIDRTPILGKLADMTPLEFQQVRRTPHERMFNGLIEEHHYLGYTQPVGEHLKYVVFAGGRAIACLAYSSAPRHLGPRDRFIGWTSEARRANIRFIAYNTRFLILPWVSVPHLASHILGRASRMLSGEWEKVYAHPIYYLESFVDPARYQGTCYRAANWRFLGLTTGRGHNSRTGDAKQPQKEVLGYPLTRHFRHQLASVR